MEKDKSKLNCSFCGKSQSKVKKLIAGPNTYICNECVDLCNDILDVEEKEKKVDDFSINKPREIFDYLDEIIVGQDDAKKKLSVAVYNHYKRISSKDNGDGVEVQKSNVLLLGPTGSGKTLLAQTLAKYLDVPFAIADATSLTEAGYVGEDVENIIQKLLQNAEYDVEKAQRGIVYIDEIDKITSRAERSGADVSREGVQRDLLPLIEGTSVTTKYGVVKTDYVLFIASGAFHLSKPSDMLPELQGRLPIRVELDSLSKKDFKLILTETQNSLIKQYQGLLGTEKVDLKFEEDGIDTIASLSTEINQNVENIGARRLHTVMEKLLEEVSYTASDIGPTEIIINKEYVENSLGELIKSQDLSKFIL